MPKHQSLGDFLREQRERQNISLFTAAKSTQIRLEALQALEKNELDFFGSSVYATGMLKNYAQFLGVDWQKILAMHRRDNPPPKNSMDEKTLIKGKSSSRKELIYSKRAGMFITGGLVLAILVIVIVSQLQILLTPPMLVLSSPQEVAGDYTGELLITGNSFQLKGQTSPRSVVRFGGEILEVDLDNTFTTAEIPLTGSEFRAVLTATSPVGRVATINLIIKKAEASVVRASQLNALLQTSSSPVQVIVRADGKIVFNDRLLPNDALKVDALARLQIETTEPTSIQIKINNQEYTTTALTTTWELIEGKVVQK